MANLPAMAVGFIVSGISTAANLAIAYLMRPRIDQKPIDVGKLDDLRVTGSEYGAFIPRYWGIARMGGNVIWSDGVKHTVLEFPGSGGKGTPSGPVTRIHQYTSNLGWLVSRSETEDFGRLWADENPMIGRAIAGGVQKQTYEGEAGSPVIVPDGDAYDPTAPIFTPWDYKIVGTSPSGYIEINQYDATRTRGLTLDCSDLTMPPLPDSLDPSETAYQRTTLTIIYDVQDGSTTATHKMEITGEAIQKELQFNNLTAGWKQVDIEFADDCDSFIFETISSNVSKPIRFDRFIVRKWWFIDSGQPQGDFRNVTGIADPNVTFDTESLNLTNYFDFQPAADGNGTVSIAQTPVGEGMRFYKGTTTQLKDSALIAYLDTRYGVGNGTNYAPAHRPMTMVVFQNLDLRRGRVPNFTIEVQNSRTDVNDILTDFAEDVGLVAGDLDLDATTSLVVKGYIESTKTSRRQHWENLARYWGFRFAEIDGKITTITDTFTPVATISNDLLRAHAEGEEVPAFDYEIVLAPDIEIPREVRFSTMNPLLDYFNETSRASLFADVASTDVLEMSFPIVAEPEEARKQCERMLLKLHSETRQVTFKGMPEMMKYAVGDVLEMDINGIDALVRIERKTAALPLGSITFEGIVLEEYEAGDISSAIAASEVAAFSTAQIGFIQPPRNAVAIPIVSRPIRTKDVGRLGLYVGVSPVGVGQSETVALYESIADETFIVRDIFEVPSICGIAEDVLGNYTGSLTAEDTTNTVDILFYNETALETALDVDLARNPELNLIRIGAEWVQFRTAVVQSLDADSPYRSKWRLSNLRRGRFGTASAMGGHIANEDAVVNNQNLKFFEMNESDIGKEVTFKAASAGQNIELVAEKTLTFNPVSAYTVTNDLERRTLDADSTTLNELADVVATMIDDLKL